MSSWLRIAEDSLGLLLASALRVAWPGNGGWELGVGGGRADVTRR